MTRSADRPPRAAVNPMQIPKRQLLSLVERELGPVQAWRADEQLPERIDPERHADLLSELGIDPDELLGRRPGAAAAWSAGANGDGQRTHGAPRGSAR